MKKLPILVLSASLAACSSAIDEYGYTLDPLEPMNRVIFTFNDALDTTLLKPVSQAYDFITPRPVQNRVNNFFGNLDDVGAFANSLFQLKFRQSMQVLARVINNTVFGLGGLFDVATPMGNPKIHADFGSTLDHYGVKSGPYVVLPLLGPSTVRDAGGRAVDAFTTAPLGYLEPERHRWVARGVQTVQTRANLLKAESALGRDQQTDRYALIRDSWLQYRWAQLYGEDAKSAKQDAMDAIFADELGETGVTASEAAPAPSADATAPDAVMDAIFAEEQSGEAPAQGEGAGFKWVWPADGNKAQ